MNVVEANRAGMCLSSSCSNYITEKRPALMEPAFKCEQAPLLIIHCGTGVTRLGELTRLSLGLRGRQIEINIENNMSYIIVRRSGLLREHPMGGLTLCVHQRPFSNPIERS